MSNYFPYNYAGTDMYREIHDAKAVATTVTLQGEGVPYVLDAWTGEVRVAESWEAVDGGVAVDVTIAPNDSIIIVLATDELAPAVEEVTSFDGSVEVAGWNLFVERWLAGETVLDTRKKMVEIGVIDELKPWNQLSKHLANASGEGTYTATFTMPESFSEGQPSISTWIM